MRKRRLVMGLIAFPFLPRLPALAFGAVGGTGMLLLYLAASRGL